MQEKLGPVSACEKLCVEPSERVLGAVRLGLRLGLRLDCVLGAARGLVLGAAFGLCAWALGLCLRLGIVLELCAWEPGAPTLAGSMIGSESAHRVALVEKFGIRS